MKPTEKKSFWALMVTQFFGAFNDNVFKILVQLLIIRWVADERASAQLVDLSGAVFVAPFLIFSMIAGRISDRVGKPTVIVGTKVWELLVVAVAVISLFSHSILFMMITLFILSMQATFFGPAKYGVLPELMEETELSYSNGLLNMATFLAIIIGSMSGTFLSGTLLGASAVMVCASLLGLGASFLMNRLPAANPHEPLHFDPLREFMDNWAIIRRDRVLKRGIIAVNYFWLVGAILQLNIFLYAKHMMHESDQMAGVLFMLVACGIGLGSFLAGKLSGDHVELGLVPPGAVGMSLFGMDLLWAHTSFMRVAVDVFMLGMSGGFYEIPLASLVQWRSPRAERGRIMATVNFLSFVAILLASGMLWLMHGPFDLNPAQVFFSVGLISLVGIITIHGRYPELLARTRDYVKKKRN